MKNQSKNKKSGKLSVMFLVVGVILILAGIVSQKFMSGSDYVYSYEINEHGQEYEFEIESKEKLDLSSLYVILKIDGKHEEKFNLKFDKEDSDDDECVFMLKLEDKFVFESNKIVSVNGFSNKGKFIEFQHEHDSFVRNLLKMILTFVQFGCGLTLIIIGLVTIISKNKKVNKNEKNLSNETNDVKEIPEVNVAKAEEIQQTNTCAHCGLENNVSNVKCEYCGAPIYKKKSK